MSERLRQNSEEETNTSQTDTGKKSDVEQIGGEESSTEGYEFLENFMKTLREKYPDKEYYSDFGSGMTEGKKNISYVAYSPEGKVAGVINGEKEKDRQFKMFWFATDPEFQSSNPAEKLWKKLFDDFDKIRGLASVFGMEKGATEKQKALRQKALVKYYEKLGFKSELAPGSRGLPGGAVPMSWERAK